MSWNHSCCMSCWVRFNGDRTPARILDAPEEKCCFCANTTRAGIYVRKDPRTFQDRGTHGQLPHS